MKRKIICFLFVFIMLLSVFPTSVFAAKPSISFSNESINLSNTEIEDDFKYVFAGAFDTKDFPLASQDEGIHFITSIEGRSLGGKIELYLYVYNPSRKQIAKSSGLDRVILSTFTSESDEAENQYEKREISLVKTYGATKETGSITNALLLKYKLELNIPYDTTVDRFYRIGEIEIFLSGESTATAFNVGKEFRFFNDSTGNVDFSVQDFCTLEIDSFHTFYRVNTEGVDEYTDIQSIYFPVSNEILKLYGDVFAMNVTWEVYWTNQGLVVDNESVRDAFYKKWVNNQSLDFKYSVLYKKFFPHNDWVYDYYVWGHNVDKLSEYIWWDENTFFNPHLNQVGYKWENSSFIKLIPDVIGPEEDVGLFPIKMVFTGENLENAEAVTVTGEQILSYLDRENWNSNIFYANWLYTQTFTVEQSDKELGTYEMCSGWEQFWHGDYYEKGTGEKITYSNFEKIDIGDLKTLTKEEFSKKYLVDINDIECEDHDCGACFACRSSDEKYSDCTWFLLRYDTTRYQSYDALVVDNTTGSAEVCNAHIFEAQVIRNFDKISATFKGYDESGAAVYTVFPIVSSPTNSASDATSPSEKPTWEGLKDNDNWEWLERVLKIILFILVILVLFKLWDVIRPILSGTVKVVKKPFEKFKGRKKK